MALRSSSSNASGTGAVSVPVPTGVAADDIVVVLVSTDGAASTAPTGFTQLDTSASSFGPDGETVRIYWKRATGADTGSYTGGIPGFPWSAQAFAFSGRDTTNPPVASTIDQSGTIASASTLSVSANGVTALAGDDLLFAAGIDINGSQTISGLTAPTGFTTIAVKSDTGGFGGTVSAHEDNVSAGATGTVTGTASFSASSSHAFAAWLIRIPAASSGTTFTDSPSGALILGGSRTEAKTGADAGSGALILSGSRAEAKLGVAAPSGAVVLGGSVVDVKVGAVTPSGALVLGGSLADAATFSVSPVGALIFGGSRAEAVTFRTTPTGVLVLGGSRAEAVTFVVAPSGAIILGGLANEGGAHTWQDSPSGALVLAGSLVEARLLAETPVGALSLGGGVGEARTAQDSPVGALALGGSLTDAFAHQVALSGAIILGGSVVEVVPNARCIAIVLTDDAAYTTELTDAAGALVALTEGRVPVIVSLTDESC